MFREWAMKERKEGKMKDKQRKYYDECNSRVPWTTTIHNTADTGTATNRTALTAVTVKGQSGVVNILLIERQ